MLRLSKKTDYALMAMKHLALLGDRGSSSAREIAEQYDIPVELMAKVLQRLARKGLLSSHQGTRGGYELARPVGDHLGRRRHPGRRRPADGHRLLGRRPRLRSVLEVQRPRSAVADQGPHPRRARDVQHLRDGHRHRARHGAGGLTRRPRETSATPTARPSQGAVQSARAPVGGRQRATLARRCAPVKPPLYFDAHATTPCDPRGRRGDAPVLHRALRQRREPSSCLRLGRPRRRRAGAR